MPSARILIIRASQLGDTVFATALLDPLCTLYGKDAEIHWLAKYGIHNMFKEDDRITRVISIRHRQTPLIFSLAKLRTLVTSWRSPYDLVLNMETGHHFNGLMQRICANRKVGMPFQCLVYLPDRHAVESIKTFDNLA